MSSFNKEFYPAKYGAFESAYSRSEESGAKGCGAKPRCSEVKWITEKQKKWPFFHQKQVPNMECVLKKDAYRACLASAGSALPDDLADPTAGMDEDEEEDVVTAPVKKKKPIVSINESAEPSKFTLPVIIGGIVLLIVLIVSIILIIRAIKPNTPVATA